MTALADRLHIRGFIEGVEIPIISAQIQCAPNSPILASVQVPPLAEGTKLLPRTLIHLYYLDFYATTSPFLDEGKKAPEDENSPTDSEDENDLSQGTARNRDYKLLFVGEVVGFVWAKGTKNRSLVLQCEDLSNYWDYAYQYENSDIFGPGINAIFSGGATNLFTDFLSTKGSTITNIVASGKCNAFPNMKGLSAGIIRLVEAIGGTYFPRPGTNGKKIAGQNLFFSLAELRLRLTGMITAYDSDTTSENILQRQGYSGMFDRALGGMGGQTSIRQAISAMTKIIFHETYGQPCPMYIPGSDGEVSGVKRTKIKGHPIWGFIADEAEKAVFGLESVKSSFETSLFAATPNAALVTQNRKRLQDLRGQLLSALTRMRANAKSKPPDSARTIYSTAAQALGVAVSKIGTDFSSKNDTQRKIVFEKIDEALLQLRRAVDLTFTESASKDASPARLVQQILRPDIWFGAPPRCNVIFPELYDTLSYQRMFLQEPTRFLLKTNDEFFGEDALFDKLYFAPQAGTTKGDRARLTSVLGRELLDHELFTGILPVFEKMGEFNVFAARSGTASGPLAKVGLAQRSANFLYFKHRFNARKMLVAGRFNPYVAVGFPGIIFDKYVDVATIALYNEQRRQQNLPATQIGELLGTNFLANFTQVVHTVSQGDGGRTEITCTFARQPDESVEFLGTIPDNARVQKKDGTATRATDVAAVSPPKVFSFGPNLGRIVNVQDVTPVYVGGFDVDEQTMTEGKKLPLFDVGVKRQPRNAPATLVPVGLFTTARELGSSVVEEITGDPDRGVTFRAYRVVEEVPRYRKEDVLLPAEEYIRPGWYGDCWSPLKIGDVYNAFFGIGSVTTAHTFVGPGGSALGQSLEAESDASAERAQAESADDPRAGLIGALQLEEGSSIQEAVEFLQLSYSFIRQNGIDVREFIRAYTWRPIATMVDMFGTSDLQFSSNGESVEQGVEGFHSRAFGPYNDLFGLTGPDIEDILGIKRGSVQAQRADTRLRKLQAVQQFVSVLRFSRAILG
jgi:hypothetical protein